MKLNRISNHIDVDINKNDSRNYNIGFIVIVLLTVLLFVVMPRANIEPQTILLCRKMWLIFQKQFVDSIEFRPVSVCVLWYIMCI